MKDDVSKLVEYRMEQATETLQVAKDLMKNGHRRDAVNRAYYAMFYAGLGLLASKTLGTSKHSGVIALFGQHFIKPGLISSEVGRFLQNAFDLRQQSDYREFSDPDEEQVRVLIEHAETFLEDAKRVWGILKPAERE